MFTQKNIQNSITIKKNRYLRLTVNIFIVISATLYRKLKRLSLSRNLLELLNFFKKGGDYQQNLQLF